MDSNPKYLGTLVEFLDEGRLKPGLVVREQANLVAVVDTLRAEHAHLAAELDLNLLWEVVREQGRSFTAEELAELFFGGRSASATSAMLEALFNDRLYFVRRHMEFVA